MASGDGMSPILANIYLSELDAFVEEYKRNLDKGNSKSRPLNRDYSRLHSRYMYNSAKLKKQGANMSQEEHAELSKKLRQIQLQKLSIPYYPAIEPNFKRLQYNRYADDCAPRRRTHATRIVT